MPINLKKCQVLHMGKSNTDLQYSIESHSIVNIYVAKDLGMWVDKKLKFSDHITRITSCANRLIGLLKRTYLYITPEIFKIFYKTIIRPRLEYASHIWSPFCKKDTISLEKVQRRATKCFVGISKLQYRERLYLLGLICLENRRRRADLLLTWKLINGLAQIHFKFPLTLRRLNRCRATSFVYNPPSADRLCQDQGKLFY